MVQLVEEISKMAEGCGFHSRWCHWNFHWHNPSSRNVALGTIQSLKRNEEYFLRIKAAGGYGHKLHVQIVMKCGQPQPPGTLRTSPGISLYIYIYIYIYTHTHTHTYITVDVLKVSSVRVNFELYQAFRYTNHHSYIFTNISHIILSFVTEVGNAYKRFDLKLF